VQLLYAPTAQTSLAEAAATLTRKSFDDRFGLASRLQDVP